MLLAIDIGNTQTVIGLYDGPDASGNSADGTSRCEQGLLDHWRIATKSERTADEHALMVQEFLGFHGFSFDDDIDGIVDRMVDEVGSNATIVATGGLAGLIGPYTRSIELIEPWLTLHALRLIFAKNVT